MSEFDNTVELIDEEGNEVTFEILDRIELSGKNYVILTDEDYDNIIAMEKIGEEYYPIEEDNIISKLQEIFQGSMDDFMSEVEDFAEKKETEKIESSSKPSINETFEFELDKYLNEVQNANYEMAVNAYNESNYKTAFDAFQSLCEDDNTFAFAYLGMMLHYGEGCEQDDIRAYACFKNGYEKGCPLAASWLGECYRMGYGVEKDKEFSTLLYNKAESALKYMCYAGDSNAIYFYSYNLIYGIGCDVNEEVALSLLQKAEAISNKRCATLLAECYINGWGCQKNPEEAVALLTANCDNNSKKTAYLLARCYYYGDGVSKDYEKALKYFKLAASNGHGSSKDYIGDCYYYGNGISQNYMEAAKWYKDAADNHKIGSAAHSYAFMLLKGEGITKDKKTAMRYFLIAAEKGVVQAQKIVSQEYLWGDSLEKDYEKARVWMEKAALKGDPDAQVSLGRYYVSDFGFDDDQKAFDWFMKAAEQGYAEAERIVGLSYINDFCVARDESACNMWLSKAVEHGDVEAKMSLGINYIDGVGGNKRIYDGLRLLEEAATEGFHKAQIRLATLYYKGIEGLSPDYSKAKQLAEMALDGKDADGYYLLAQIIKNGFGDVSQAKTLYLQAISLGNNAAKLELSKIYIEEKSNYESAVAMLKELISNSPEAKYYYAYCLENGFGCIKDKSAAKKYYAESASKGYQGNLPRKKMFGLF